MTYRPFLFENMQGCDERKAFYKANWDKPITLEQFIAAVRSWPRRPVGMGNKTRRVGHIKRDYKRLRELYGFFPE